MSHLKFALDTTAAHRIEKLIYSLACWFITRVGSLEVLNEKNDTSTEDEIRP